MRMYALFVLLMYATALNFEASLMSHTLAEVDALDTSQLNCQTPRSHFEDLEQTLTQWQQVLENKERIPSHIETLTQMKHLIKHKKYEQLVEKIKDLDLISPPVLSELQNKLQGLQSHDRHEREECTETLTKLCAYLIKQMNNVHQQCQQSPVTVIKVKGKIEDLKIIQSGCQQSCQPTCPDEPAPETPSEAPSEEFTEEPVEEGVPPTTPDDEPTPDDKPTPDDEPTPDDKPTPDEPIVPQDEEGPTDEPPVNPNTEESPDQPTVAEEGTEEWTIPGEEPEEPKAVPTTPDQPEEDQEESSNPPVSPEPLVFPEEQEESFGFEETPLPPVSPDPLVFPEEEEESFGFEETPLPPVTPDVVVFPEEEEESFGFEETPLPPVNHDPLVFPEEEEESFGFEETPHPRISPLRFPFSEEHEEIVFEEEQEEQDPIICQSSESTDIIELTATQVDPGFSSTLTIAGEYGFGLYFQRLQKYPAFAEGDEFHLASLQDNGNTVLGVFVTNTGVKCVTVDGSTHQSTSVSNSDFEGEWSFVFISHGQGVTGCAVKFFEELPALRSTPASHATYTSLDFKVGGPQDSHPSFQGKVYGQFASSVSNLHFNSQRQYNLLVDSCNSPPEVELCELYTDELGDYQFYGFEDTSDEIFEFSTWDAGYAVSGWLKWETLEDQDVWHTVFRLSENADADLEEIKLGDRDLAVFLGNELVGGAFQFSTYTYSGSGNPNLWDNIQYTNTLGQWHHIYFGYNRLQRIASFTLYLMEDQLIGANQLLDARHYLVPWRRLYIGNDGLYPAFNGQFYNWRVNRCIGDAARDVVLTPDDIPFGYNPQPVIPESRAAPQIETFASPEEEQPYWGEEEQEFVPVTPDAVPNVFPEEEQPYWPEEEEEFVPPAQRFASPEEEQPYWGEEEQEFVPPPVSPPVIPDEIQPEPLPEPEPQPEPEAAPAPAPKPAPGPAPPSEPQVPVVKECEATIDVTKENAADILCAISEYLAQLASGHVPELGINPSRVCFCLQYDDSESNESFMQVEAILKENDAFTINKLVAQR